MRPNREFYERDVLEVAPDLLGKFLCRRLDTGETFRYRITETEAYDGNGDLACHASKGRTDRTEIMFHQGGLVYVYLIYGMYWMLNVVTGKVNQPQAVLIRGLEHCYGPGRLTRAFKIDKSFYGEDLCSSHRLWIEADLHNVEIITGKRIGIDYAGEWKHKEWRYYIKGYSK
ncbi:MAG: DNA-3-methyladenine glycosylase [Bacteroidales bacterium]|nr:DNA-3-methyladenine glycosylase [Bacteroidales bacterium]